MALHWEMMSIKYANKKPRKFPSYTKIILLAPYECKGNQVQVLIRGI